MLLSQSLLTQNKTSVISLEKTSLPTTKKWFFERQKESKRESMHPMYLFTPQIPTTAVMGLNPCEGLKCKADLISHTGGCNPISAAFQSL